MSVTGATEAVTRAVEFVVDAGIVVAVSDSVSWALGGAAGEWVGLDAGDLVRFSASAAPDDGASRAGWIEDVFGDEHRATIRVVRTATPSRLLVQVDVQRPVGRDPRQMRQAALELALSLCDGMRRRALPVSGRMPGHRMGVFVCHGEVTAPQASHMLDHSAAHLLADCVSSVVRIEDPVEVSGPGEIVVVMDGLHDEGEARQVLRRLETHFRQECGPSTSAGERPVHIRYAVREGREGAASLLDRIA